MARRTLLVLAAACAICAACGGETPAPSAPVVSAAPTAAASAEAVPPPTVVIAADAPAAARTILPLVERALATVAPTTVERVILRRPFDPLAASIDADATDSDLWMTLVIRGEPGADGSGWPLIGWESARLYARLRLLSVDARVLAPIGYNTALASSPTDSGDSPLPSLDAPDAATTVAGAASVRERTAAAGFELLAYTGPAADGAVAITLRAPAGTPAEVIARWPEAFAAAVGDGAGTWLLRLEAPNGEWVKILWQEPLTTVRGGVTREGLVNPGAVG